jgi:ubiquinone/menaquinone biosynthesis C-methylase UbiE
MASRGENRRRRNEGHSSVNSDQCNSPAEIYETYLGRAIAEPATQVLLEHAIPHPGERVLDLACGTGSVARHVAPMVGASATVVAVDINPDMLDVARALPAPAGATIDWRVGDAVHLELPSSSFDLVLCQQGLQFFSDRAAAARGIKSVLSPDGRAVLSVWQNLKLHPLYEALFEATARHLNVPMSEVDVSFSLGEAEELQSLLTNAGFQRVEITARSFDIHLPSPDRFVELTVRGAASSVPAFARLNDGARSALVAAVSDETDRVASRYRDGDSLRFRMSTHIAVACTEMAS